MFDFEKFKRLCRGGHGFLDIRKESDREYFVSYLKDNGIPSTAYVVHDAPYVYWESEYNRCFGWSIPRPNHDCQIYNIADFETVMLKAGDADILNFLGV